MSTLGALMTIAFSHEAPSLAPALIIRDVARAFVPKTITCIFSLKAALSFSTMDFPMPPPYPSITSIYIEHPSTE